MTPDFKRNLIKKYLDGECNALELAEVRKLLQDPQTAQIFDEIWTSEWNDKIANAAGAPISHDARLSDWKKKMRLCIAAGGPQEQTRNLWKSAAWRRAAVWLLFACGLSFLGIRYFRWHHQQKHIVFVEESNPMGKLTKTVLPDSSIVYLGPDSKIRFRERLAGNYRDIQLVGEAYFEVKHNDAKPFRVQTGNLITRDVGTSFKITAIKGQALSVAVATGKVTIEQKALARKIMDLTPGQKMTWENGKATTTVIAVNDISTWKNGLLVYNKQPLKQIAGDLARWYNIKFIFIGKSVQNVPMTIKLTPNVPVTQILEVLSISGQFKYVINGNTITIKAI